MFDNLKKKFEDAGVGPRNLPGAILMFNGLLWSEWGGIFALSMYFRPFRRIAASPTGMRFRGKLNVVLMSATLDSHVFTSYFGAAARAPPALAAAGRKDKSAKEGGKKKKKGGKKKGGKKKAARRKREVVPDAVVEKEEEEEEEEKEEEEIVPDSWDMGMSSNDESPGVEKPNESKRKSPPGAASKRGREAKEGAREGGAAAARGSGGCGKPGHCGGGGGGGGGASDKPVAGLNVAQGKVPVLTIPGRTFPVKDFYLSEVLEMTGFKMSRQRMLNMKDEDFEREKRDYVSRTLPPRPPSGLKGRSNGQSWSDGTIEAVVKVNETGQRHQTDLDLAAALVWSIVATEAGGGILVFLPGTFDINKLCRMLTDQARDRGISVGNPDQRGGGGGARMWVLPLHSALQMQEQKRVFVAAPRGVTKVVCATNVAETSITVSDIKFVIDSGKHKEMDYDPERKMGCLREVWVSKAAATQRKGRAGRVSEGKCFKLYTRRKFDSMDAHPTPEIHRSPLEQLVLKLKLLAAERGLFTGLTAAQVLELCIEPPPRKMVASAVTFLHRLQALAERGSDKEAVTPLGRHLATLPVGNVQIGKILLLGCMLRCVEPCVIICALMSGRSPLQSPPDRRAEADREHKQFKRGNSDYLTLLQVYKEFTEARAQGQRHAYSWCKERYVSFITMQTAVGVAGQLLTALASSGFLVGVAPSRLRSRGFAALPARYDANSRSDSVVLSAVAAGLYPNVVEARVPERYMKTAFGAMQKEVGAKEIRYFGKTMGERVFIHPRSCNFHTQKYQSNWMVYVEKRMTSRLWLSDCSQVPPYALLLFGDEPVVDHDKQMLVIDGWIKFKAPARVGVLVKALRRELQRLMLQKARNPLLDMSSSPVSEAIIRTIQTAGF